MRIAFISTMAGFSWGGSEELWSRVASEALKQNHQVLVSVFDWGEVHPVIRQLQDKGASIHLRPKSVKKLPQRFYVRWFNKIKEKISKAPAFVSPFQHIEEFQPDIICVSQGFTFEVFYEQKQLLHLLLSRKYPYCLISQFGFELGTLPYSRLEDARRLFGYAAKVLFVSDRNKQVAERQLAKALDNAEIISNPVNLTDFSIVSYPQTQQIRFACVARLDCNFKGQDILLQTLSTPLWRQRDWLLNFYGKGPDEQFLKDLALFYKIDHKVRFCGHVSSIRSVWADNHIQIMPSIGEGTPLSLLEAMVCGRTAVVTDVGGNASMIEQEELGFLAAAASVQALDEALERAWKAKNQWQEMGEKAHQAILQKIDLTPELAVLKCLTECK